MKKKNMNIVVVVLFLFILAFAIRLFLIQAQPHIAEDGVAYAMAGAQLIKGQGFSTIYPPFYPFMIGLFSLLFGALELSGRLVSVFYGSLLIFPLFFMARWAFGNKIAIISCLLTIIYPNLCQFSSAVLSESTFMFLFLLGLIISWVAVSNNKSFFYILAGLTWGIAYLTRPEGVGYFLFLALIILIKLLKEKRLIWIGYLCLVITGFLIISAPYLFYLKKETGRWSFEKKSALNLALGENVGKKEDWGIAFEKCYFGLSKDATKLGYEIIPKQHKGIVAYILSNPRELIRRYIINLHLINKYVIPGLFYPIILILFGAGLSLGDIEKTKKASVLFLGFVPYLTFPFFIVAPRYFVPFVPIMLIWVARGIVEVSRWVSSLEKSAVIKKSLLTKRQAFIEGFLVVFILASFIPFTFRPFLRNEVGPSIYKEIGVWINSNLLGDSVLICRKPWIPFYAEKEQVPLPFASFDEILKFARYRDADYLIADENVIGDRSELRLLFDEDYISKDLKIIYKFKNREEKKIYIYKILD